MEAWNPNYHFHYHHQYILLLLFTASLFHSSSTLKMGETCSKDSQCDAGFRCNTCAGSANTRPRCVRIQPILPTSKVKGLPFNKYSWLTTHNSYAIYETTKSATGTFLLAPTCQEDSVTSQLRNGVRGLMLDMYDFENDIWLCHSFGGKCFNFTTFTPAINVLKEVHTFLQGNPSEIVTIFIEDYVTSPKGLTKVFNASGLSKFMFPLSQMPKRGYDWPSVDKMVQKNQRLVVFTSLKSKEASEGIAYQWNYLVENQYGDDGMVAGTCYNRDESLEMYKNVSLVLMNYFPSNPSSSSACVWNSDPLMEMTETCFQKDGLRWPNFIAVDYYQRSDDGGPAEAVDESNGYLACGCGNIALCKGTYGSCITPKLAPPPPASLSPPRASGSKSTESSHAHTNKHKVLRFWLYGSFLMFIFLLVL